MEKMQEVEQKVTRVMAATDAIAQWMWTAGTDETTAVHVVGAWKLGLRVPIFLKGERIPDGPTRSFGPEKL